MNKPIALAIAALFSGAVLAQGLTLESPEVKAFLAKTTTRVFDLTPPSAAAWSRWEYKLQKGIKAPNGSCNFKDSGFLNPGEQLTSLEVAVNRDSCESLIFEGVPTDSGSKALEKLFPKTNSNAKTSSTAAPNAQAAAADGSFNEGGPSRTINYKILYTDGNEQYVRLVNQMVYVGAYMFISPVLNMVGAGPLVPGRIELDAASVSITHNYNQPAVSPVSGNCYYNGSNQQETIYYGVIQPTPGFAGWTTVSSNTCTADIYTYGRTVYPFTKETINGGAEDAGQRTACFATAKAKSINHCNYSESYYHSHEYYSAGSAVFNNTTKIGVEPAVIFDCSSGGGLTISFNNMNVYGNGLGGARFEGDTTVSGPVHLCSENLARYVTKTSS